MTKFISIYSVFLSFVISFSAAADFTINDDNLGDDPYLVENFKNTEVGDKICYQGQYTNSYPPLRKVSQIDLELTKDGDNPSNPTGGDYLFLMSMNVSLVDTNEELRLYGCCTKAGICSLWGSCAEHTIYISGKPNDILFVNLSEFTKHNEYYQNRGETETLGDGDLNFLVERTECQ